MTNSGSKKQTVTLITVASSFVHFMSATTISPTPGWTTLYFNTGGTNGAGDWTAVSPGVTESTAMADPNYTTAAAQWTTSAEHHAPNNAVIQFKVGVPGTVGTTISDAGTSLLFPDGVVGGPWHIHADYSVSWGNPSAQKGITSDDSVVLLLQLLGPGATIYTLVNDRVNYPSTLFYYGATMETPLSLDIYINEAAMGFPETGSYRLYGSLSQSAPNGSLAVAQGWLDNLLIEELATAPEPGTIFLGAMGTALTFFFRKRRIAN